MRPKDPKNTQKKEQLILAAARDCFITKGFHRTTMRDIAAQAQISLGGIYRYFPGKNEIILKFIEISNQETDEALTYIRQASDFISALQQILDLLLQDFTDRKSIIIHLEILSEALKNEDVRHILNQEKTETDLAQLLEEAVQKQKVVLSMPPLATSLTLLSAVETAACQSLLQSGSWSQKEAHLYLKNVRQTLVKPTD